MSGLNGKSARAEAALESYLSLESPAMRSKVYEIIHLSGLEPDDPMFLVLALTGQMRVFLEAAPEDLGRLLTEWKRESASSLSEVMSAIALAKDTQQEQANIFQDNLSDASQRCVSDIKKAGMAATSALADANSGTLEQLQATKEQNSSLLNEVKMLRAEVEATRKKSHDLINNLIGWFNQTTEEFQRTQQQIRSSHTELKTLQQKAFWLNFTNWYFPLLAFSIVVGAGFLSGSWVTNQKYNGPVEQFGRNITQWNLSRISNCQKTDNPKCTIWIVHPNSPLRKNVK
ncbi:MAG: DUF6753 family protein [Cyanobacteria bacterium J06621_8]